MVAVKRVLWYFDGMIDWRLCFGGETEGALKCYLNTDYAGCLDDYMSRGGLVIAIGEVVEC
jgi:hypothetical protein